MKKIAFIGITTLLVLASCAKENSVTDEQDTFVPHYLTASLEQENTKATLNNSLQTVWQTGDVIGVYVTNYKDPTEWDWDTVADCSLSAGQGTTVGTFNDSSNRWCFVAFYPRVAGTAQQYKMKFNLPVGYYDYTSGMNLLPMMADMSGGEDRPSDVSFKHVGGGVKISVNDVPGNANSIGMTVAGKKITGAFDDLEPTTAGTSSGKLVATTSSSDDQTVYLNFATASSVRDFDFIFPVPTVTSPSFTFKMWNANGLELWSATATSQPNIDRGELLVFPTARTISEAKVATHVLANNIFYLAGWNLKGTKGDDYGTDYPFNTSGVNDITIPSDGSWVEVYNGSHYYKANASEGLRSLWYYIDADKASLAAKSGSIKLILNNNGSWQSNDISLNYDADVTDYVIKFTSSKTGEDLTSITPYYSLPSHAADKVRIWVWDDSGNSCTNLYVHDGSNPIGTAWPGASLSGEVAYPTHANLVAGDGDKKVFIPAGVDDVSISYNSDGSLTLNYTVD